MIVWRDRTHSNTQKIVDYFDYDLKYETLSIITIWSRPFIR